MDTRNSPETSPTTPGPDILAAWLSAEAGRLHAYAFTHKFCDTKIMLTSDGMTRFFDVSIDDHGKTFRRRSPQFDVWKRTDDTRLAMQFNYGTSDPAEMLRMAIDALFRDIAAYEVEHDIESTVPAN